MNIKNSIIKLLLTTVFAVTFCSCSDWLDYKPKDETTENQQFSTRAGFYSTVNGVYNNIASSTLYGGNLTYGALDFMAKRYESPQSQTNLIYLWSNYKYTDSSIKSTLNSIWQGVYQDILNINVVLKNVDNQKGVLTETDKKVIKGDLLSLRAFLHFDMLRLFGPVYSRTPDQESIPYNDGTEVKSLDLLPAKEVIYNHIIPDLDEAMQLQLSADPVLTEGALAENNENGDNYLHYRQLRMNYFATALLKARVYLWAGDTDKALESAKLITDNEKVKKYFPFVNADKLLGNTVNPDRTFSTEVLFGFYDAERDNVFQNNFDGSNLSSTSLLQPRTGYMETLFTSQGDYRGMAQWGRNGSYYNFVKYKGITYNKNSIPLYALLMPLIRVSEAYYIAAECEMNKNNNEAAISYLNAILNARGATLLDPTSSKADISKTIISEYIREFWGEGQIFYMFKRNYMTISKDYNADNTSSVYASTIRYVVPLPSSEQDNR